jgi:hypothetical protein
LVVVEIMRGYSNNLKRKTPLNAKSTYTLHPKTKKGLSNTTPFCCEIAGGQTCP